MGDLMPGIPSLPGDETSWQAFTDQFETLKRGDKPISLTNWDSTDTVPAVAAGSALEIAGATYRFPSESVINAESGLASGVVYVVVKTNDPDENSATAYFTNTAPEWRDDLNGWYDTTGANRYTGHLMDWDGASAYTGKRVFTVQAKGGDSVNVMASGPLFSTDIISENITSTGTISGPYFNYTGEATYINPPIGTNVLFESGLILITIKTKSIASSDIKIELLSEAGWVEYHLHEASDDTPEAFALFSNGSNCRYTSTGTYPGFHYMVVK